jgi:hypothetical protein
LRNNLATLVRIVVDRRTRASVHRAQHAPSRRQRVAAPNVARLARRDAARSGDARLGSATRNDETRFKAASE